MADDDFISVEEVAAMLGVSIRQASRYSAKVRTERANQRVLFHRGDIIEQARLKGIEQDARARAATYQPKPTKTDLVPAGDMLEYIRERDRQLAEVQAQLNQALLEIGRLQGQLTEHQQIRQQLTDIQAERDQLKQAMQRARPWWQRWFNRDETPHDD